jgi:hypothetical protein
MYDLIAAIKTRDEDYSSVKDMVISGEKKAEK